MTTQFMNITIESKEELDRVISQYQNGGKALMAMDEYQNILRNAYKHGFDDYLKEIERLMNEHGEKITVDENILSRISSACLEYFRTKYYECKNEYCVED
jgi:hypothetical protein